MFALKCEHVRFLQDFIVWPKCSQSESARPKSRVGYPLATVREYLQTWKLKLSTTKTVSAAFHFNSKEAKRERKVNLNNETLPFFSDPKYLGVTLDRSLTYRRHLESLRKKLPSRVALLRRLAGSGWVAGATTLRTVTLALVRSTAEY